MQLTLPLPEFTQFNADPPPLAQQIFCNRSLRLDQIEWIGFDMDYTLAVYHQEEMDRLSVEATLAKLVARGYPASLSEADIRLQFPIRGLLIDRELGNVLKMDRFKYVKRAYHGFRELSKEERREAYHKHRIRPASDRYHWVDTLYGLSEVSLFATVIEHLEREVGGEIDFDAIFRDIRESIDLSHQDGTILDAIEADPARCVRRDPQLQETLHRLLSAGKRLFIVTNSHPPYTEKIMTYLLGPDWRWYFELVVTASKKPIFFTEQRPFHRVQLDEAGQVQRVLVEQVEIGGADRSVYWGGNAVELQRALGCDADRVLYIGDHIFGDVLRAKKEIAWRTMMIIQEMGDELRAMEAVRHSHEQLERLSERYRELSEELFSAQRVLLALEESGSSHPREEAQRALARRSVNRLKNRRRKILEQHDALEHAIAHRFHPYWGALFKAGGETSSFGDQVETYADLYTSHVSNLLGYSALNYFESPRDKMPHEL